MLTSHTECSQQAKACSSLSREPTALAVGDTLVVVHLCLYSLLNVYCRLEFVAY